MTDPSTPSSPPPLIHQAADVLADLRELLGREWPLDEVARRLRIWVQHQRSSVVGALHVTCADEAELECREAFRRGFVRYLLPTFKFSTQAAMECTNLGSRYEWGAAGLVEDHFATARGAEREKIIVIKINAHVSVDQVDGKDRYGRMQRYDAETTYCGALQALLAGKDLPATAELAETFAMEGKPRLEALRDPRCVDQELRALYAAITSARLQARRAIIDIDDHVDKTSTMWLVVPCVSLNRRAHDSEIVVGVYSCDRRQDPEAPSVWWGLHDDPGGYQLQAEGTRLAVADSGLLRPRAARDHRSLVLETFHEHRQQALASGERLEELRDIAEEATAAHPAAARASLATLLALALEVSPIPAALVLFGQGALATYHIEKAHRLAREAGDDHVARAMLTEMQGRIDGMDAQHAQNLVRLLGQAYGA
ncbi:MAG: hypothetical protein GY711_16650 [bacterium]|nr:hypothetical protein [bacterium]